ncbi:tetratricopeptide repeat protein [Erythrobacter sp.]|uniref:tetratricopeptide repeat protein n=1 Tax=Erythrobacter sp. TaxID=1042 RepID=UPI001425F33C|nr:tetratricopeptide repeat protein [Erythrobacter sp.]QIQ88189.1 MAG: tetratricopeptide repeat protein [Erythrobacter sp.]
MKTAVIPRRLPLAALAAVLPAFIAAHPATAQEVTSREVVQPLPSPEIQRLNRALMELARAPKSLDALVEAGDASLAAGDLDAAMGFYGRADDLDANNARVKLGIAAVYLRSGRPVEALEAFALAERAGAKPPEYARDRGLAYDLVGDHARARTAYEEALAVGREDPETRRRLALSFAIAGNRAGFEDTLRPLLDARDYAAFRTRAFGLAILGDQARAAAIVDAVMPRDLAGRLTPYLAYMPRLTPAQQAAAANLGIFPRAAEIGREDPRIARFAREAEADRRLEPAGAPLGTRFAEVEPESPAETAAKAIPQAGDAGEAQPLAPTPGPAAAAAEVRPGFDLAQAASRPVVQPLPQPKVADAFADLDTDELPAAEKPPEAVDIAAIEVPREKPPEPEPPAHPRRIWVQVATGQDLEALKFDWRRIARAAGGLLDGYTPHTTPWGQANRLLAGPLKGEGEAREMVNALKAKGLDTFPFTSPEGKEIQQLD